MHGRLSTILKTSKTVYEVMFFDMKKYVCSESVFNTPYIEAMLKKFPWDNRRYKKCPFFLLRAPTHRSFTFNFRFLYELMHKVRLSKTLCGISHFRFRFIFIKVYIFV